MFSLRRREPSVSNNSVDGISDTTSSADAGVDCNNATLWQRPRTDQNGPAQRPKSILRRSSGPRLSENEKARISIYLRVMNAIVVMMSTFMFVAKEQSVHAVDFVRAKGVKEMAHLVLVWSLSSYLLVNVSFFSIHPHPPMSPTAPVHTISLKRRLSRSEGMPSVHGVSFSSTEQVFYPSPNTASDDAAPLIDLSSRSSVAGDTPPPNEILVPAVLSPTQLQIRSLSPDFEAAMRRQTEEVEEILTQPSKPAPARNDSLAIFSTKYNRLTAAQRGMSTVSYPDIDGNMSLSDEDESNPTGERLEESEEEEDNSPIRPFDKVSDIAEEAEDEDGLEFPTPDVDIPYVSSPSGAPLALGPEKIEVLATESRQATIDMPMPIAMPVPVTMPEPVTTMPEPTPRRASVTTTPPPSRVTTIQIQPTIPDDANLESPRDVFSPTIVPIQQRMASLSSFALPFVREPVEQPVVRMPEPTVASQVECVQGVEENKVDEKEEPLGEPTPYPSPPFTPPSSRPPTMYNNRPIQMPTAPLDLSALTTPDPFVRGPLSALVEEAKAELEAAESKKKEVAQPVEAPVVEAVQEEEPVAPTVDTEQVDYSTDSIAVNPPESTRLSPEEPIPIEITEPEPAVEYPQVEEAPIVPPPRAVSPVTCVGLGGVSNGSRINVDDLIQRPKPIWSKPKEEERIAVSSGPEEALNEVGTVVEEEEADVSGNVDFSGIVSGADDESSAPKSKLEIKKKKKKTKRPKAKKGVSFDENPFVIGSDQETPEDSSDASSRVSEVIYSPPTTSRSPLSSPPITASNFSIPVPKTFEVQDEEEEQEPPALIPSHMRSSSLPLAVEALRGSPASSRRNSIMSDIMSPRSTADEMSDSSAAILPQQGKFTNKQVDHYGRWFARAHRDKSLPTVQQLRTQMEECGDADLAARLKLGSRAGPTKLTKSLTGELLLSSRNPFVYMYLSICCGIYAGNLLLFHEIKVRVYDEFPTSFALRLRTK
ncbi:hypothetical protein CPB86DRAFT_838754 [Serendipita vermifera]|nr:hypothetical protein CPB86DRAFT_838754 [Serendipita vermifera]